MGIAHWDDVERHRRAEAMDAICAVARYGRRHEGVGATGCVRTGRAADPSTRTEHQRRSTSCCELRARWQDERCTRCARSTASSTAPTSSSITFVAGPDWFETWLRHEPLRGARLAASLGADRSRVAVGRGADRRSVGPRSRGVAAQLRRARRSDRRTSSTSTSVEPREVALGADGATRHERALRRGRLPPGASRSMRAPPVPPAFRGRGVFVILEATRRSRSAVPVADARRASERDDMRDPRRPRGRVADRTLIATPSTGRVEVTTLSLRNAAPATCRTASTDP